MDYLERAKAVISTEVSGLQHVQCLLNESFNEAVRLLSGCLAGGHKIVVTGVGKNFYIAEKLSSTFCSTGSSSVVLNPTQALHGDIGIVNDEDVLIALSYSGSSQEVLHLLNALKNKRIACIGITGNLQSDLAQKSDIVISCGVEREACPFNLAPTTSTTATLALGDALAICLLEHRGITLHDYAALHPAGAIGNNLLLKVKDLMRSGNRLASVPKTASLKDALLEVTKAKSGTVTVVNDQMGILGVLTDGDLRRAILKYDIGCLNFLASELMNTTPVTIDCDAAAVSLVECFKNHHINSILVKNDANQLVGVVDIQDLPKFKLL